MEIVKILIDAGASLQASDEDGLTPLMVAARKGNAEIVAALIEASADLDVRDADGWTALRYAAEFQNKETEDLLRKSGAR